MGREFGSALSRGDFAAMASFFAEDATMIPEGGDVVRGRLAIQQLWQAAYDQRGLRASIITVDQVGSSGDLAYEVSRVSQQLESVDGEMITDMQRHVLIWRPSQTG
jgi:ketosteroid isomerase-like protein